MHRRIISVALLAVVSVVFPAHAVQMQARSEPPAVAAPTQPVVTKPLEAPEFESDTKRIQEIISQEPPEPVKPPPTIPSVAVGASAVVTATPVAVAPAPKPPVQEEPIPAPVATSESLLTHWRIVAIRWHEVVDVAVAVIFTLGMVLVYCAIRKQNALLAALLRTSEDTVRATQASAQFTQELLTRIYYSQQDYPEEGQGRLDL